MEKRRRWIEMAQNFFQISNFLSMWNTVKHDIELSSIQLAETKNNKFWP